ncbi:hypothetical protein Tco_0446367 [Tanacetum coccineum]
MAIALLLSNTKWNFVESKAVVALFYLFDDQLTSLSPKKLHHCQLYCSDEEEGRRSPVLKPFKLLSLLQCFNSNMLELMLLCSLRVFRVHRGDVFFRMILCLFVKCSDVVSQKCAHMLEQVIVLNTRELFGIPYILSSIGRLVSSESIGYSMICGVPVGETDLLSFFALGCFPGSMWGCVVRVQGGLIGVHWAVVGAMECDVENDLLDLVVEIESFGMSFDEFDKETGSSDGLQPNQADLSYVYALNELHLHAIHVVLSKHEADQC